ncbi:MAG TPA: ABC transporter substrate-binding protein [Burkholderiaceae bacterium]|nr:ABC transporter substrate-binding protein [Burkholderiaceae bacterium]
MQSLWNKVRAGLAALLAAALCAAIAQAQPAAKYEKITLAGPTALVSFPLLHMLETGALNDYTDRLEFRLWQSPDQLRVLLAKKEIDFSAAPSNLPALMANRGEPVRLLNISVWGILWLVSRDPSVKSFSDIAGKELLLPFHRDLPSVLVDTLLAADGNEPGNRIQLRRTRASEDAIALMLTGQGQNALLVEPTASLLMWRNERQGGAPLYRVESLEDTWRARFPDQADLPQAGIMANSNVAGDLALSRAVERAYAESADWCVRHARSCAEMVNRHIPHLPVPAVENAIKSTRLESRPASEARPQLEALYTLLGKDYPQAIGGRLPDVGFYGP